LRRRKAASESGIIKEKKGFIYNLACFLSAIVFNVFFRSSYVGIENVPDKGAGLLCSNHLSILDMFLIGYKLKRKVHSIAKTELFKYRIGAYLMRNMGAFPIKRGQGDVKSIKASLDILQNDLIIGIFPEGTRNIGVNKGRLKAKPGAALLAIKSGAPIIPVLIIGNFRIFTKLKVIYGKPYHIHAEPDKKYTNKELSALSAEIMGNIYNLGDKNLGD
jgi:1-acyl-sn-glycerol-3-phosphate acyltransferase